MSPLDGVGGIAARTARQAAGKPAATAVDRPVLRQTRASVAGAPHRARPARAEPTPETHPKLFTADGLRKWKVPPTDVEVIPNTTGEGSWIEKWRSPTNGRWVHNYTVDEVKRRAGLKFVQNR